MNKLIQYYKKQKYLSLFIAVFSLIALGMGFYMGIKNSNLLQSNLIYYSSNISSFPFIYIIFHLFILFFLIFSTFLILGLALFLIVIFIELFIIGFISGAFFRVFSLSGFFFSILYIILLHVPFIFIVLIIFKKCLYLFRQIGGRIFYKKENDKQILRVLKTCGVFIIILLIYEVFIYFFGGYILKVFHFLL